MNMTGEDRLEITDKIVSLYQRVGLHAPVGLYQRGSWDELLDDLVDQFEADQNDWQNAYDENCKECLEWKQKYIQCHKQRNRLFRLLRSGLIHGVITNDDLSDLLRMMELSYGSDVSNVENPSLES